MLNSKKEYSMKKARIWGIALALFIVVSGIFYYTFSRTSVSSKIHISTNPWVGFTPFIYAQEKGWLEKTPFRFIWLVDLTDNARLYARGFTKGFTATQYELLHFNHHENIKPIFLIDRSYGADAIVSNRSIEEIRQSRQTIAVYLEQGSLHDDFFKAFIRENRLEEVKFHQIDSSQKSITVLVPTKEPIIILSYEPYLSGLIKKGFAEVCSTRTLKSFYVVDALFVDESVVQGREKEFARLKELFALGIEQFQRDPHEYYNTVKGYLEGQSYEEFMATTTQIEWLHSKTPREVIDHLESKNIKTDKLLP
jgi:NitT/TauT family transport system substrate-binding protein